MPEQHCDLSVIIPAFQEGDHLYSSIAEIREAVRQITADYEIIIVDDGSTDTTWEEIRRLRSAFAEVRGLRLSRNFGKDAALAAGLAHCVGNAALTLDADLQHPPSSIAEFYNYWKQGFDIVEGIKANRETEHVIRRSSSKVFNWLSRRYTGLDLTNSTDFKLLDRKVINAWLQIKERRLFFRGIVAWMGFSRKQLSFDVRQRAASRSKWSTLSLLQLAISAVISFSSAPLRIAHHVAAIFILFAALLGARALYLKLNGTAVDGFTTVIIVLLLNGGLILIVLGIIAEYLAAIYEELKARPRYFVEDSLSSHDSNVGLDPGR